ncbi:hypothetical protein DPMN_105350 [Dreissena polymorpha]|uniref:Uncharacterized protein n=1 Tax=Dreissena polymorpha TaxID=45954 RepID=A0A9D4H9D8_DREPO|nr:hypothetical protein DPMN_105350 [Dreissena polymorpha]
MNRLAQTEDGPHGNNGVLVQSPVETGCEQKIERATIQRHPSLVVIATDNLKSLTCVITNPV